MDRLPDVVTELLRVLSGHLGTGQEVAGDLKTRGAEDLCASLLERLRSLDSGQFLFKLLLQHAPHPCAIVNGAGGIIAGNPRLCALCGVPPETLVGRRFADLLHEQDREAFGKLLSGLAANGGLSVFEARVPSDRGEVATVSFTAHRLPSGGHPGGHPGGTAGGGEPLFMITATGKVNVLESVLQSQQTELETVYENAPLMICLVDGNRRLRYANKAFRSFISLPQDALQARTMQDILGCPEPDGGTPNTGVFRARCGDCMISSLAAETLRDGAPRSGRVTCQMPAALRLGSVILTVHTARVDLCGQPFTLLFLEDITDREQAETALRDSDALYGSLVENLPQYIIRKNLEGQLIFANSRYCDLRGCGLDELLGKTDYDFFPQELAEKYRKDDLHIIATGKPLDEVERHVAPGGREMFMQVMKTPVRDARGNITGVQGIFWDITDRVTADRALALSEERLRLALEATSDGLWDWDIPSGRVYWSPRTFTMLGYRADEFPVTYDKWQELVHPEDREAAARPVSQTLSSGGSEFSMEFRITGKDGVTRWILGRGKVVARDRDGKPLRILGTHTDITGQKEADRIQRESEQRLKGLIESIPHVAIQRFTVNGVIEYWNRASEEMYGYSESEAIGKDLFTLLFSDAEEIAEARESLRRLAESDETCSRPAELQVRTKSGDSVTIYSNYVVVRRNGRDPEIFCIDVDLSELKRAEKALRESEMRYRAFLNATPDLAFLKDSQYRYIFVNRANQQFFGRPEAQILGKTDHDLMPTETADACRASDEAALKGRVLQISEERAGSRVYEARKFPIMIGDQEEGVGGFIHDVTYRKKLENERLALERDMLHAQKLESLGVMAGGIAHDFNNLLLAVMGNIDLALEDLTPDAEARISLESAVKAARRGADLTRQILAYSGKTQARITEVDLNELVRENAGMLATILDKKAVLSLETGASVPMVMGDPAQIQQVIMNLMTNASESLRGESGTVRLVTGVMACTAEQMAGNRTDTPPKPGNYVWLEVSDTGCGMDEETLARLFDPFFTTKFTGRGLGMSAVLGIMKAHQGAIFVDSAPGCGTTTRLLFPPAANPSAPVAADPSKTGRDAEGGRFSGTALVVDDDDTLLQMAERILSRLGFEVMTARNGLEALDVLRRHLGNVRVVLLDVTMPVMDGPTALAEMRAMAPDLPVILSSGYNEGVMSEGEGMDTGPGGFLQKPYRMDTLRAEIARVLGVPFQK